MMVEFRLNRARCRSTSSSFRWAGPCRSTPSFATGSCDVISGTSAVVSSHHTRSRHLRRKERPICSYRYLEVTVRSQRRASRAGTLGAGGNVSTYLVNEVVIQGPMGLCRPTVYLDGIRFAYGEDTSMDTSIPLSNVQADEVYRRPAEVPVEYDMPPSDGACGVIVIGMHS